MEVTLNRLALVIIVLLFFQSTAQAAVPATERAALAALYNSTNGAEWTRKDNWLVVDPCTNEWYGVICDQSESISQLHLGSNGLFGTVPAELGNLVSLQSLSLSWNHRLHGSIPSTLGNLSDLRLLGLDANNFSGSIPAEFGKLTKLQSLDMWHNNLSGSIPAELGNLVNLTSLDLSDNHLSGSIPAELGNLVKLRSLLLFINQLSGPIPAELGKLRNVYRIRIWANQLTDPIPAELGNLSKLRFLALGDNQLSGAIPPELGKLERLEGLSLDSNALSGSIPSELGQLPKLKDMNLSSNKLRGSIPSVYRQLPNLNSFGLSWNALHTEDAGLDFILNGKSRRDWSSTQTVAPKMVSVSGVEANSVKLSWTPIEYVDDEGGYRVWYGKSAGGPYMGGGMTADKSSTSNTVTGLELGQRYYFVVTTQTNGNPDNANIVISENSSEVYARTVLARPTGIKATNGTYVDVVKVSFETVEGATLYRVFRCLDRGQSCGSPIGYPKTGSFEDRKAVPGTVYYYRVRACSISVCGKFSVADSGFATMPPDKPTRIRATDGTYSDRVQISWDGVEGAIVYRVFRCQDTGPLCGMPIGFPHGTSFDDRKGDPGTVYYYRIKACTTKHCSKFSVLNAGHRSDTPDIEDDVITALMIPDRQVPIPTLSTWGKWLLILMTLCFGILQTTRAHPRLRV